MTYKRVPKDLHTNDGAVMPDEGPVLAALTLGKRVLEIGTLFGSSARWMAPGAESIVTVDPDPQIHGELPKNVKSIVAGSHQLRGRFKAGQFDVAFIDGDHTGGWPRHDFILCAEALDIPTIIMHDTSGEYWEAPKLAAEELSEEFDDYRWLFIPTSCGLTIASWA